MEITINEKTIKVKYGFKALMIYERIDNKSFAPKTLGDIITFFYCCVLASNEEISYEEFINWLDDNAEKITEFSEYLSNIIESQTLKKVTEKENQ